MKTIVAGIDIGGTKCAVTRGCVDGDKSDNIKITEKISFPTPDASGGIRSVLDTLAAYADRVVTPNVAAVGISCGGPLDSAAGVIKSPPNLPGWDEVPVVDFVKARYGIPAKLRNDANACALAEYMWGAGRGSVNMLFLTFGTGMGAGVIINGELYEGASGFAGEAGHVRLPSASGSFTPEGYGKTDSFEGWCSGGGIARYARHIAEDAFNNGHEPPSFCRRREDIAEISAKTVAEAAYAGNADALAIYETVGERLGEGLAMLVDLYNPDRVVIGSIYARSRELLYDGMMRTLTREALPDALRVCEIVPAALGDDVGDYAALGIAMKLTAGERTRERGETGKRTNG